MELLPNVTLVVCKHGGLSCEGFHCPTNNNAPGRSWAALGEKVWLAMDGRRKAIGGNCFKGAGGSG